MKTPLTAEAQTTARIARKRETLIAAAQADAEMFTRERRRADAHIARRLVTWLQGLTDPALEEEYDRQLCAGFLGGS